jgi:hypothetical protein
MLGSASLGADLSMPLRGAFVLAHAFRTALEIGLRLEAWWRADVLKENDLNPDLPHHHLIPPVALEPCHA